ATTSRDSLVTFARTAAERFPPGHPLAFYGPTIRTVVVYVGRPLPSLERRPERIQPGEGLIAFEPAYRKLASAALAGAPLAFASGRIGNAERATLVLAEGTEAAGAPQTNSSAPPESASRRK